MALDEARTLIDNGNIKLATKVLVTTVRLQPKNVDAWLLLASIVEPDYSKRCLEYVLSIEPNHPVATAELAKLVEPAAPQAPEEEWSIGYWSEGEPAQPAAEAAAPAVEGQPGTEAVQASLEEVDRSKISTKNLRPEQASEPVADTMPVMTGAEAADETAPVELAAEEAAEEIPAEAKTSAEPEFKPAGETGPAETLPEPVEVEEMEDEVASETVPIAASEEIEAAGEPVVMEATKEVTAAEIPDQAAADFGEPQPEPAAHIAYVFNEEDDNEAMQLMTGQTKELIHSFEAAEATPDQPVETPSFTEIEEAGLLEAQPSWAAAPSSFPEAEEAEEMPDLFETGQDAGPVGTQKEQTFESFSTSELWPETAPAETIPEPLEETPELILPVEEEAGGIPAELLDQVRAASALEDYAGVFDLLSASAGQIRATLQARAEAALQYREPEAPRLTGQIEEDLFVLIKEQIRVGAFPEALTTIKELWAENIGNADLREWAAYLYLRNGNPAAAEALWTHLQNSARESARKIARNIARKQAPAYTTDWNMAVLCHERSDEPKAFWLLRPWLDRNIVQDDLVEVLLWLALRSGQGQEFLSILPRTRNLRFHPLAFTLAYELGDEKQQKGILTPLLYQEAEKWELPPVETRFKTMRELLPVVNRAIVECQSEQAIAWLSDRIKLKPFYIPNYLELARVYETEKMDIQAAYQALSERLDQELKKKPFQSRRIEEGCRDLLDLCTRHQRRDLGEKAYQKAVNAGASDELLALYSVFQAGGSSAAKIEISAGSTIDLTLPTPNGDDQAIEKGNGAPADTTISIVIRTNPQGNGTIQVTIEPKPA